LAEKLERRAATEDGHWQTAKFFHLNPSKAGESCQACRFL
jgi:hypothetical protein